MNPLRLLPLVLLLGCGRPSNNLVDQPRAEPYEASAVFEDGGSSRQLVPGVLSRDGATDASGGLASRHEGTTAPVTSDLRHALPWGRERFMIHCSPCHGLVGEGDGMVALRGHPRPPSLHTARLREVDDAWLSRVIEQGLGTMPSYAHVRDDERAAIVLYLRALQLSQHAPLSLVPVEHRARLLRSAGE